MDSYHSVPMNLSLFVTIVHVIIYCSCCARCRVAAGTGHEACQGKQLHHSSSLTAQESRAAKGTAAPAAALQSTDGAPPLPAKVRGGPSTAPAASVSAPSVAAVAGL